MNKYENLIAKLNERHDFSELEKEMIMWLTDYCHVEDFRHTDNNMYEAFFKCDGLDGRIITTRDCESKCAKYGCSTCSAAGDLECLINKEKGILDFEQWDEIYFKSEIEEIVRKYYGNRNDRMTKTELNMLISEISRETEIVLMSKDAVI